MPSTPVVEDEDSVSKVLTDNNHVGDILKRLHCPTCFVSAALTSKHWLRNAADQAIIRDFHSRQSPHHLGVYICTEDFSKPEFMPLGDALSSELGAAVRHGNFRFDNMDKFFLNVWDCRNDRILYGFSRSFVSSPTGLELGKQSESVTTVSPRHLSAICQLVVRVLRDSDCTPSVLRIKSS
ncbi:unnamed protein product [Urochloa humidicola]